MKAFLPLAMSFLYCLLTLTTIKAQDKHNQLTNITNSDFNTLLEKKVGETIELVLPNGISFHGTIISNEKKFDNFQVAIAKSSESPSSLLQFYQRTDENHVVVTGGKLQLENAIYILEPQADGRCLVQSKTKTELLQDCALH